MMKSFPIILGTLLSLSLLALGSLSPAGEEKSKEEKPKEETKFYPIDLQPLANQKLDDDFHGYVGNNLKPLPRDRQKFKGVVFTIGEKFVQLAGKRAPDFPEKIEGIPVNRKLTKLHFLHATGWGSVENGTEIGHFEIHYDDNTSAIMPIEYGHDLRDWWDFDEDAETSRAVVAWRSVNEASANFRNMRIEIRLFLMSWTNVHPDKIVKSFDYVSKNETMCSPFLVAASAE
jgi:hypothetical protein